VVHTSDEHTFRHEIQTKCNKCAQTIFFLYKVCITIEKVCTFFLVCIVLCAHLNYNYQKVHILCTPRCNQQQNVYIFYTLSHRLVQYTTFFKFVMEERVVQPPHHSCCSAGWTCQLLNDCLSCPSRGLQSVILNIILKYITVTGTLNRAVTTVPVRPVRRAGPLAAASGAARQVPVTSPTRPAGDSESRSV
jgi:hypothetical protein